MSTQPGRILVIRNDKLGDFMLAWPALSLLKQSYPDAEISVLIPAYTSPLAQICPWIDNIIIDDQRQTALSDAKHLAKLIKPKQFDASITLFSEYRVALALWLAHIPLRIAPATKIFQFFHNRRLVQRRSRSIKPEYVYNVDLVRYFISLNHNQPPALREPPFLSFESADIDTTKNRFFLENRIDSSKRLVFIHPGTGGSANNLSLQQYADLAGYLSSNIQLHFVITAGPDELKQADKLSSLLANLEHTVYHSTMGLVEFAKHIAFADIFISGSTGPLHIAGALNVRTAAFYPARRSATSLRWRTLNSDDRNLAFSSAAMSDDSIDVDIYDCYQQISNKYLQNNG